MKPRAIVSEMDSYVPGKSQDEIASEFNLNKDETVFFDDKVKNVLAAKEVGIKSYVFNSIEDIENVLDKN